jgi:electron transport complex protein RnfA
MTPGIVRLLTLAVFSGLSMNLILQFCIGMKMIVLAENHGSSGKPSKREFLIWFGIHFTSVTLLWLFFLFIQSVLSMAGVEYILLFPLCYIVFTALEYLVNRFIMKKNIDTEGPDLFNGSLADSILTGNAKKSGAFLSGSMTGAALFITSNIAGNFAEALMLSLGFSAGIALAIIIMNEIRKRSEMEAVPACLKGGPLVLITMGLLSMIFSSAAIMFFNILAAK